MRSRQSGSRRRGSARSWLGALLALGALTAACASDDAAPAGSPVPSDALTAPLPDGTNDARDGTGDGTGDTITDRTDADTTDGSGDGSAAGTSASSVATGPTSGAPGAAWVVDTSDCEDPAGATAPIEGTVRIGSVMPLSGGAAAAAFGPVADGFRAYVDHADERDLLGDLQLELVIADDQYQPDLTPGAVATLIESGVHLFSGIAGTPNNLAVRETLNAACVPQLNALTGAPEWGEPEEHPWTTGLLVPYTVEAAVYAAQVRSMHPAGATVAVLTVDNEFGRAHADAFAAAAADHGLEIVETQTIDPAGFEPPVAQLAAIAAADPDAILAVPLGAGCISFLTELAAATTQHPGWMPDTFITSTCASSPILGAAGAAADGVHTAGNLADPDEADTADPDLAPGLRDYVEHMTSTGKQDVMAAAAVGWTAGEVTVAILAQAMASPAGLSRASIIEAARNLTLVPSLGLAGVVFRSAGAADPYLAESLQVVRWSAAERRFQDVGELITDFESS